MGVEFLGDDYVAAANEALQQHEGFNAAISGVSLALQFHVTDMPSGEDVEYYVDIGEGDSEVGMGELEDADVTITNDYETAVGIATGDLNTQMAFMTGKIKVSGEMAKLLLNQNVLVEMTRALSKIDTEF